MSDTAYQNLVERAASETCTGDTVSAFYLQQAASAGYDTEAFEEDVTAETIRRERCPHTYPLPFT